MLPTMLVGALKNSVYLHLSQVTALYRAPCTSKILLQKPPAARISPTSQLVLEHFGQL